MEVCCEQFMCGKLVDDYRAGWSMFKRRESEIRQGWIECCKTTCPGVSLDKFRVVSFSSVQAEEPLIRLSDIIKREVGGRGIGDWTTTHPCLDAQPNRQWVVILEMQRIILSLLHPPLINQEQPRVFPLLQLALRLTILASDGSLFASDGEVTSRLSAWRERSIDGWQKIRGKKANGRQP